MEQQIELGVESGISADAFDGDPVKLKHQTPGEQQFWLDELTAAKKERAEFNEKAVKTIKRYSDERDGNEAGNSYFNIFFANTEIKMAALYARTPKPDIKRRFNDADDDTSRVAGNILERNISYELENDNFDATFKHILFDRLVPGMGIGWVRLEQEEQEPAFDAITGQYVPGSEIANQSACIDYVSWDDFIYAPCRVWSECRWVGRRVPMTKDAVSARFADTVDAHTLQNLSFTPKKQTGGSANKLGPKHLTDKTIDVLEVWDKERKLVFWITDSAELPLDVQADTNELPDFFPTPLPPLGRFNNSSTIPISDYKLVQDQYRELDDLNNRCSKLTQALKLQWVYDAGNEELKELYQTGAEFQGIPIKNWSVLASEKGGLRGSIEFTPLDEIAGTYQKLLMARDVVKNQIYEIEGISDILRGASTPYETAAAVNQKSAYSSTRISVMQHDVADYVQRLLRLKAHLICKFYKPEFILSRAGMPPVADQQMVPDAMGLLKNEQMRHFRLEVSVDSIQLPNWDQEKQERNELINAVTNAMAQLIPAVEQNPKLAPFCISLLKFGIAGYRGAKDIEGALDAGIQQMLAEQDQGQAKPKPPSPAEVRAQAQQLKNQTDLQIAQMQEETKRMVAQQQAAIESQSQRLQELEVILKQRKMQADIAHNQASLHIDLHDKAHSHAFGIADSTSPTV